MGKIREYTRQVGNAGAIRAPRMNPDEMGLGQAIQGAARDIRGAVGTFAELEEQKQSFDSQMLAAQEQADMNTWLEEEKKKAPPGADGFTESVKNQLEERRSKALDSAPSEFMRRNLELRYTQIHNQMTNEAMGFEAQSHGQKLKLDMQELAGKNNNIVRSDSSKLEQVLESELLVVENSPYWDQNMKAQVKLARKGELFDTAMDGKVTGLETSPRVTVGDVNRMIADLQNDKQPWKGNQTAQGYDQSLTRLQRLKETLTAKEKSSMVTDFDERMDQIEVTGQDHGLWTEKEIKAKFGNEPAQMERMLKREMRARAIGQQMSFVKATPDTEIISKIKEIESSNILATTDEFHKEKGSYDALRQAFSKRLEMQEKDFAGYTMGASTAVANVYNQFQQNRTPEMAAQYADLAIAEQKRLSPGSQPALLPLSEVGRIAAQMNAVNVTEKGTAEAFNVIKNEQVLWGDNWPLVAKDLRKNKAITDEQYVAASMFDRPEVTHIAEDIMRAGAANPKDLAAQLPEGMSKSSLEKAATAALEPLEKTLKSLADGREIYSSYHNTLVQTMMYKKSDDATGLAKAMVLDNYYFGETYRVPRGRDTSSIDYMAAVIPARAKNYDLVLPKSGLRAGDTKDRYADSVRREGTVVTNGDESGLRIMDSAGRQVMHRVNGKEVPLSWTWQELEDDRATLIKKKFTEPNLRHSIYKKGN